MSEVYFLGAVSGGSFRTEFPKLIRDSGMFTYILKGGPGTGKSSMMKRIAEHFEGEHHIIRFCCSSDPGSLDAVVIPSLHSAICDGTSPHVFEPVYPGICQKYLNLGEFWNEGELADHRSEIIEATDKNRSLLQRAQRFTAAAADITSDTFGLGSDCLLADKLEGFVGRFTRKLLGRHGSGTGEKSMLRLTALTEYGILTHHETLESCGIVYTVRDSLGTAADYLLSRISDEACARGYDVILSPEQLLSDAAFQHLIIPELGVAIISGTAAEECAHPGMRRLNLMRFYDKALLSERRMRLKLNRAAVSDLISEAVGTVRSAKLAHDEIERYYISSMDFDKLDRLTEKVIREIEQRE